MKEARQPVAGGVVVDIDNIMKKLSPKQKIARMAHPYDKITGADFKVLKKRKKENEIKRFR